MAQRRWDGTNKELIYGDGGTEYPIGGAGQRLSASTKTADYTLVKTDYSITVDASSNTVDITFPSSPDAGRVYNISCTDSTFAVTLDFNGNTLYGDSTETLYAGENITVQYNGTQWIGA